VAPFIAQNYCGVKRIALRTDDVQGRFAHCLDNGAVPLRFPTVTEDEWGTVEEAAIRLYDHNEITFTDRTHYHGPFKPGYQPHRRGGDGTPGPLLAVDHIAAELRINQIGYWTQYLTDTVGTRLVQSIRKGEDNRTGMIMNINQSPDGQLVLVMAEPDTYTRRSKIQQNVDTFGPGIHHLAFATDDIVRTTQALTRREVEFVSFPPSYYELLRGSGDFAGTDLDELEQHGILIDREGDTCLLQKFIKPISDRPFFLYEIVQRVNGYSGFALKNINVLKRAEELQIMNAAR
jgi:4-hydroxyphenylpyruvate dioxygenase